MNQKFYFCESKFFNDMYSYNFENFMCVMVFFLIFLVLEQVIGTTLVLRLCSCDCLTIGSETVNDGTRF